MQYSCSAADLLLIYFKHRCRTSLRPCCSSRDRVGLKTTSWLRPSEYYGRPYYKILATLLRVLGKAPINILVTPVRVPGRPLYHLGYAPASTGVCRRGKGWWSGVWTWRKTVDGEKQKGHQCYIPLDTKQPGNGVVPIPTAPEPTRGGYW